MFGLFGKKNKIEAKVEIGSEKPLAADVAVATEGKRRSGRILSADALRAHDAVAAVLTTVPQTRSAVIGKLDEAFRPYVNGNWQNIMARLMEQHKVRLADGPGRGRGVAYIRA